MSARLQAGLPARQAPPRAAGLWPAAAACLALAAVSGAVMVAVLHVFGGRIAAFEVAVAAGPALATAALAFTSQRDRRQYVLRLLAAGAMLPLLALMVLWPVDGLASGWRAGVAAFGYVLLHLAGFALLVGGLASATTRLEAAPATAPVDASLLAVRLRSLVDDAVLPWRLSHGDSVHAWVLDSVAPDAQQRYHRILLDIHPARAEVRVRERYGADGARPLDADEASMRVVGDAIGEVHPDAQRVWLRQAMTTIVEPHKLAAVALQIDGAVVRVTGGAGDTTDDDTVLTLLAALVTRSGYAWQPVLWRRGRPQRHAAPRR
jgi:hypothetical protein